MQPVCTFFKQQKRLGNRVSLWGRLVAGRGISRPRGLGFQTLRPPRPALHLRAQAELDTRLFLEFRLHCFCQAAPSTRKPSQLQLCTPHRGNAPLLQGFPASPSDAPSPGVPVRMQGFPLHPSLSTDHPQRVLWPELLAFCQFLFLNKGSGLRLLFIRSVALCHCLSVAHVTVTFVQSWRGAQCWWAAGSLKINQEVV